ncbi:MAG: hypothetical protein JST44_15320 [Cyanobacteria bacterium SZAS LIN-5]|nr:hypothetical protein [Cyanobacteria bacterium SZAS LIN-5]
MPDIHNVRPSQRENQIADRQDALARQHAAAADQANNRMWAEVQSSWGSQIASVQHRTQGLIAGAGEWINDRQVEIGNAYNQAQEQASHIIPDAYVRTRHALRELGETADRAVEARERVLYPENQIQASPLQRTLAVPTPHAEPGRPGSPSDSHVPPAQHPNPTTPQHGDTGRQPSTHSEHPRTAHGAEHRDYVVRRGDNLSSIVRADEQRRHPGTHDARREHLRVQALVNHYGETILPGMHIEL